jgi:hypothetical protein
LLNTDFKICMAGFIFIPVKKNIEYTLR